MNLEELLAERDIQRQLIAFARAMDERDWDALGAIAAETIRADFGMGEIEGRDQVIALIRSFLDHCGVTQHLLGNIIINVSGDRATSQSYVSDMHLGRDGESSFRTLGNYSDQWKKIEGNWLLVHRVKDNRATVGSMDVFKP